jgi:hypothetical protein
MAERTEMDATRWIMLAVLLVLLLAVGHFGLARVAGLRRALRPAAPEAPKLRYGPEARDVAGIPAPPQSTLQFSAVSKRPEKELAVYAVGADMADVEAYYSRAMPPRGWEYRRRLDTSSPEQPSCMLTFKGAKTNWCTILISTQAEAGTIVTVFRAEMSDAPGDASPPAARADAAR